LLSFTHKKEIKHIEDQKGKVKNTPKKVEVRVKTPRTTATGKQLHQSRNKRLKHLYNITQSTLIKSSVTLSIQIKQIF
jgi:hypothetical protein